MYMYACMHMNERRILYEMHTVSKTCRGIRAEIIGVILLQYNKYVHDDSNQVPVSLVNYKRPVTQIGCDASCHICTRVAQA